jgi:hypothetical protein
MHTPLRMLPLLSFPLSLVKWNELRASDADVLFCFLSFEREVV